MLQPQVYQKNKRSTNDRGMTPGVLRARYLTQLTLLLARAVRIGDMRIINALAGLIEKHGEL